MNRVALLFALTTSLLTYDLRYSSADEKQASEASDDEARAAARKVFDNAKLRATPMVNQATSQIIAQKEVELNAIRPRAEQLRREMRRQDMRGGLAAGLGNPLSGTRAGDYAELEARDADIKSLLESIDKLKQEHDQTILKTAWLLLNHETRTQIIESKCLSDEETEVVQSTIPVQSVDLDRLENSLGLKLRLIPAGEFKIGASGTARLRSEAGAKNIEISKPFWIAETEVTQRQYQRVTGENPSELKSPGLHGLLASSKYANHPVDGVSWYEAVAFCRSLSKRDGEQNDGRWYRLPTEAEWEYACRAGTTTSFYFGNFQSVKGNEANIDWRSFGFDATEKYTVAVSTFGPNAFGLFDMHGNVMEWCSDWYQENYYIDSPDIDPPGPATGEIVTQSIPDKELPQWPIGELKVSRGGAFNSEIVQETCLSNSRTPTQPGSTYTMGFRIVCEVADEPSGILQEQYQQLADFEAGKPRAHLLTAQKQYYVDLKTLRDTKLKAAQQLDQQKENSREHFHKILDVRKTLADIYKRMAEEYAKHGDTKRASEAYVESGKWSLQEGNLLALGGPLENPQQQWFRLLGAAEAFANGGDLTRAQQSLDQANKTESSEWGKQIQGMIDQPKNAPNE